MRFNVRHARLEFRPISSDNPRAVARFSFSVSLGDGVVLSCLNGLILRDSAHSNVLSIVYPRARWGDREVATWTLGGNSQRVFDDWVVTSFRSWLMRRECVEGTEEAPAMM